MIYKEKREEYSEITQGVPLCSLVPYLDPQVDIQCVLFFFFLIFIHLFGCSGS